MAVELNTDELMMKVSDQVQDMAVRMARLEEKVENVLQKADGQQSLIDRLEDEQANAKANAESTRRIHGRLDEVFDRVGRLEKQGGDNALAIWKKIGGLAAASIVGAVMAWLISFFSRGAE